MDVLFANGKLQKLCNSAKELQRKFGKKMAARIQQRIAELAAAPTLKDMEKLPAARCHELLENLSGKFAVKLIDPERMIFEPAHNPVPRLKAGNVDTTQATKITILAMVDYHGK